MVDSVYCFAFYSLEDPAFRLCLKGLVQDSIAIFEEIFPFQIEAHSEQWGCGMSQLVCSVVVVAIAFLVEVGAVVVVVAVAGVPSTAAASPTAGGSSGAVGHAVV